MGYQCEDLGKLITSRRKEIRLSGREVARRAGISAAYLIALETGVNPKTGKPSRPSNEVLARLDNALNLGEEAYRLVGYAAPKRTSRSLLTSGYLRDRQWGELLNSYAEEGRTVFLSLTEKKRGEFLEEFSEIIKRYKR
ncbi:MAG: helix-turn-helix domain-containing protein [Candidatus Aenigmarchaeota archaeon]|nr:helix-turn-helix domain-containing protein [Candidatus Aenigmarchaeota archaeon]